MNPIVRNILAVVAGLFLGGVVNMGMVTISDSIIPLPEGADVTTPEGLKASIHLFEPRHFIMPFLAHALGTFVGALVASLIAANRKMLFAIVIGLFNLTGGIVAVTMIPAPMWFNVTDLVLAYIPMAFLAGKLGSSKK